MAYNVKGKDHYLAELLDLFNREIIERAVSDKNDTILVLAVFDNAHENRGESLKGAIHHTDVDVRYCSDEYILELKKSEMKISMCIGNAYENARAKSFNKTIKRQKINISDCDGKEESVKQIFRFIDLYDKSTCHTTLMNNYFFFHNYSSHFSLNNMMSIKFKEISLIAEKSII